MRPNRTTFTDLTRMLNFTCPLCEQESAQRLLLRYSQRWAKDFLRHRLDWSVDESYTYTNYANHPGLGPTTPTPSANYPRPRHLNSALCPCQFIEDYLRNKPRKDPRSCCPSL